MSRQDQIGTPPDAGDTRPPWYDELISGLTIRSHFVVTGNTRDLYASPLGPRDGFRGFEETLWRLLMKRAVAGLLIHDPVDGLRLHPECDPRLERFLAEYEIEMGQIAETPAQLAALQAKVAALGQVPVALVVDYASHIGRNDPSGVTDLFLSAHKAARRPMPARPVAARTSPPRNPTFWIADRPADLPDWFTVGNEDVREIVVELPTLEDRFAYSRTLTPLFHPGAPMDAVEAEKALEQFALACDGGTLRSMRAIAQLANIEELELRQIPDAIATYRTGSRRNPWKSPVLRQRMQHARGILTDRVKGQDRAVDKTLDILMRSITGLSGAQTTRRHARPRGVLFFAGPTGVGKTELAKAVTELLFGDETACQRYDMSEFMEEDSINRLIGAPPGYPGHERGGELINAIHKRPFSVFLFDEIEKAHPRILDTFLQILDEGRLTDARGATAHFSEALIIFTSNIGMFGNHRETNMGMNIMPSDPHHLVVQKIVKAVQDHFRFDLKRPELINRIGQNVVVFDFIDQRSQAIIFHAIVARVIAAVQEEQGIALTLTDRATEQLRLMCTHDVFDGGRGIANRIETHLINPLARELFFYETGEALEIDSIREESGRTLLGIHKAGAE